MNDIDKYPDESQDYRLSRTAEAFGEIAMASDALELSDRKVASAIEDYQKGTGNHRLKEDAAQIEALRKADVEKRRKAFEKSIDPSFTRHTLKRFFNKNSGIQE